jgi:hypothetical protein
VGKSCVARHSHGVSVQGVQSIERCNESLNLQSSFTENAYVRQGNASIVTNNAPRIQACQVKKDVYDRSRDICR